jgi:HSP20 family molecular chaperone IbpA
MEYEMSRTEAVRIRKQQSVANDIARINERIMQRAREIFESRGGSDLDNWLAAENEVIWRPPIELRETENQLLLTLAVPGVDPKEIEIEATPDDIVVKADFHHEHAEEEGAVHSCEFMCGSMFRTVHFPKRVNPDAVKAEYKNGILKIQAPLSKEQTARKIEVDAA